MLLTDILTADQKGEDKIFLKKDYGQWILNIKLKKKLNLYMNEWINWIDNVQTHLLLWFIL